MGLARPTFAQQTYKPPEVASSGAVFSPNQPVVDGLFVLFVSLDADGRLYETENFGDPGAIGVAAKASVLLEWKFRPAFKDGYEVPSRMTLSFLYRPQRYTKRVPPKGFSPVLPHGQLESAQDKYVPVGILSFAYPKYPVNSVFSGSVVVQVTVDSAGDVKGVEFLDGMPNFNNLVSVALKRWRFQAATFNGKPITSKTVIAFAFQPPHSG